MKVLFINSPIRIQSRPQFSPYGLACLSAVLDMHGHQVAVVDANAYRLNHAQIRGEVKDIESDGSIDAIGISGLITTYRFQAEIAKILRRDWPDKPIIAGGGCASSLKVKMLEWIPELSGVIIGEGENTLMDLVKNQFYFEGVDGTIWRDGDKIVMNPLRRLMTEKEMDELPRPAWEMLPMDQVYFPNSPLPVCPEALQARRRISILSSRGCPFTCTFCTDCGMSGQNRTDWNRSLFPKKIRYHSIDYIAKLIRHVLVHYKCDFISFIDELFTGKRKRIFEFCDMLEKEEFIESFKWGATAHAKTIDPEMLRRMRECGAVYLDLGLESANDRNLKAIRKHATAKDNQAAFDMCIGANIYPITNFMVGFPTETVGSLVDTAKFMKRNRIFVQPFLITPYPATKLFEENREKILAQFGGDIQKFVEALGDATDFTVNLTKFDTPTLLGLRDLVSAQRVDLMEEWQKKAEPEHSEHWEGAG